MNNVHDNIMVNFKLTMKIIKEEANFLKLNEQTGGMAYSYIVRNTKREAIL